MKKIILFGATGNLGKEVAKELVNQNYDLNVVVRSESKAKSISHITTKYIIADVCNRESLKDIFGNSEIVISTLGKTVSPKDKSKASFKEVDLIANSYILDEAMRSGIKKFVYISAFHSEKYLNLEYFKVHHEFESLLRKSGIDYSIIRPPAIFSAFIEMIEMAKKGQLVNIGSGDKRTNPIYEGDLAKIIVNSIGLTNATIEVGGKTIYTRKQLSEIIQKEVDPTKKVRTIPLWLFKLLLPIIKIFSKNTFDKFAFFTQVISSDTIAPQIGETTFETYIKQKKEIKPL